MATTETSAGRSLLNQIERVPLDSLVLYPGNPRRGDVDVIADSMRVNAQYEPLVVQASTRRVLAGNHRLLAAQNLGWEEIDVVLVDVDDEHARRIMLSSNRTSELGSFDEELLVTQLNALAELDGTGFGANDLVELESRLEALARLENPADPDEVPPVPIEAISKLGEVYTLGEHRLMCGDATDPEQVATLMGDERAELLFTSPPYLNLRTYTEGVDDPVILSRFIPVWAERADLLAVNIGLVVREYEVVPWWKPYLDAAAGLKLLAWNVWNREEATNPSAQQMMFPLWHEWVFVFGGVPKSPNKTVPTKHPGSSNASRSQRNADGSIAPRPGPATGSHKALGSVLTLPSFKGPSPGDHPAVFPVALPTAYIEAVTRLADAVADSFAGSGSTLIAAEQTGRRCFAMEIDPVYCDVIRQRYADYVGRPDLAPGAET